MPTEDNRTVASLRNLGARSQEWLNAIGVSTRADLERLGGVEIFRILKLQGYPVSLNMVYAIEGALLDVHWNDLPGELRDTLKADVTAFLSELER